MRTAEGADSAPARSSWWDLRERISPTARRQLRHVLDPMLSPIGSLREVATEQRFVSMTFDDGPDPLVTPHVLESLARVDATATFFLLVDRAEAHRRIVLEILAAGHEVALHGLDHRRLTTLSHAAVLRHVSEGRDRLEHVVGRKLRWFRAPYGAVSPSTVVAIRRAGLQPVVWGPCGYDWTERTPQQVLSSVMGDSVPGSIVLLHDGLWLPPTAAPPSADRAASIQLVLDSYHDQGYQMTSMTASLTRGRPVKSPWFRS